MIFFARRRLDIGPDPDGGGSLHNRARRITYTNGLPTRAETGTVASQSDSDWTGFTSLEQVDVTYDANARPTRRVLSAGSTTYAVTDLSYDALGRPDCSAVRMNPSAWGTTTAACTHQSAGSYGADRITRTSYTAAGQPNRVQTGYGVSGVEADESRIFYTDNGRVYYVLDANDNPTVYRYDGFDRLWITYFASAGGGTTNWSDYEGVNYDASGNVTVRLDRAGAFTYYSYDHLGRLTEKDLPGSELTVAYGYDLMGRMTSAATSAQTLSFTFDALGRNLTQVGPRGTVSYAHDTAGRRTAMTYADSGLVVGYTYDVANDLTVITENPAGTNLALGTYVYDDRGRRTSLTRGNGAVTSYTYDNVDRLTQIAETFVGATTYNRHVDYTLDPASAIASSTGSSDSYAWTGHYAVNRGYTANGLNQYSAAGSITPTYDSRGNVTSAGSVTYGYSSENRLTSASGGITLSYDPLGRLYETVGAATTRMGYDGDRMIAEYNSSDTLQRRYVYGPGTDELLVWYEGTGTSTPHYYHADERGSVIALSNGSGALTDINRYDEYGIPGTNAGRFQYTGQQWLSDLGMYYYRNRIYSPTLGRFMQTDPIGFGGGMNIYAYVQNDPVNFIDPSGECGVDQIVVKDWSPPWTEAGGGDAGSEDGHPVVTAHYHCVRMPSVPTPGGTRTPGVGGGGDGGQSGHETPTCRAIRQRAEQGRNAVPSYVSNTSHWDNVDRLRLDLVDARMNLGDVDGVRYGLDVVGFAGALAGAAFLGPLGAFAVDTGAEHLLSGQTDMYRAQVEAIQARLAQIQAREDGTCP